MSELWCCVLPLGHRRNPRDVDSVCMDRPRILDPLRASLEESRKCQSNCDMTGCMMQANIAPLKFRCLPSQFIKLLTNLKEVAMKRPFCLFTAGMFAFLVSVGHSQESGSKVGIGLSIDPFRVIFGYTLPITPVLIYVPVKIASTIIEPYAGMFTTSSESSFGTNKSSSSASLIQIGGGLLFSLSSDATSRIYFGPRVSVLFVSSKSSSSGTGFSSSSESSETDFIFGAAAKCSSTIFPSENPT